MAFLTKKAVLKVKGLVNRAFLLSKQLNK